MAWKQKEIPRSGAKEKHVYVHLLCVSQQKKISLWLIGLYDACQLTVYTDCSAGQIFITCRNCRNHGVCKLLAVRMQWNSFEQRYEWNE